MNEMIIIGMGPAGLSSAIYLKRYGFNPLCIESGMIGGKINFTSEIDNYVGFMGTSQDLVEIMDKQAKENNLDIVYDNVISIRKENGIFYVKTDDGEYQSKIVIIATGIKNKTLKIKGESKFRGLGISSCAICDGPLFKNKEVAIIGNSNESAEEALYLAKICKKVYIINKEDQLNCEHKFKTQIESLENIQYLKKSEVIEAMGEQVLTAIKVKSIDETKDIVIQGLFTYVGAKGANEFIQIPEIEFDKSFIKVDNNFETSVSNLFAIGDARNTNLRQVATAVSDGALVAFHIKLNYKEMINEK